MQADGGNPEAAGRLTAGEGVEAARMASAEGRSSGAEAARMASAEGRSSGAEAVWTVSAEEGLRVEAEDAEVEALGTNGAYHIFRIAFRQLGERTVRVNYGGKHMNVYYFVTQDVRTMLGKRASFIAGKQIRDEEKWYNGLLAEYNNETGAVLSPDNYDKIGGWRIYEVTCDDPGLSKPAFLSSAQTVCPDQALGNNDIFGANQPAGSAADIHPEDPAANPDTFLGDMGRIVSRLKAMEKDARIFLVSMQRRGEEQADATICAIADEMKKMCGLFSYTYLIDMAHDGPAYDEEMRKTFAMGGHPNAMGYYVYAMMIGNYMDYIIRENPKDFFEVPFIGKGLKNKDIACNPGQ